jgi:hypothetical protein
MVPDSPKPFVLNRPLPVRVFNGVGRLLRRCGWRRPLDADRMLVRARRRTGLGEFGALDVREPLHVLVESLERENRLTPLGRLLIRREVVQLLCARLRLRPALEEHSEVLRERVERPLFIIGLGRTGSTLLHRLLSQDPSVRALRYWESIDPARATADSAKNGYVRQARFQLALANRLAPRLRSIHTLDATAPEECRLLLMNTFRTQFFGQYGKVSAYLQWLRGQGPQSRLHVYEDYRRQLQLLQWHAAPRRWVLKSPVHAYALDAILQLFPDACVVQTHRDLAEVVPSTCSLMATMRGMYCDDIDVGSLGATIAQKMVQRTIEATLQTRATHPGRVFDVLYRDLVRDPVGTVRGIYEHFGLVAGEGMEDHVRDWLARNPQGKDGRHGYSLEQWGLERATIDRMYGQYPECFGIPAAALRG